MANWLLNQLVMLGFVSVCLIVPRLIERIA